MCPKPWTCSCQEAQDPDCLLCGPSPPYPTPDRRCPLHPLNHKAVKIMNLFDTAWHDVKKALSPLIYYLQRQGHTFDSHIQRQNKRQCEFFSSMCDCSVDALLNLDTDVYNVGRRFEEFFNLNQFLLTNFSVKRFPRQGHIRFRGQFYQSNPPPVSTISSDDVNGCLTPVDDTTTT